MKKNQSLSLLVMAAGMGSRYGGIKQIDGFGPHGETIMDYSLYDALRSGFNNIVFVVREEIKDTVKEMFLPKLQGKAHVHFEVQSLDRFVPRHFGVKIERKKPWGTTHAMLCGKEVIDGPFAVINADDFYGQDAFDKAADFLLYKCTQKVNAIIGYKLANTLSEHGTVSRGVCEVDANKMLTNITERTKIYKKVDAIIFEENDALTQLPDATNVSMNFWCFHPSIFNLTDILFKDFPKNNMDNIKAEFFIPIIAEHFIKAFEGQIEVISTSSQWFGVTYKEDADGVRASLHALIANGEYPNALWR